MSKENLADLIALVVICGLSLLVAAVTRYRPPREINWLYGYRTARSMRTPEAWQEANQHFALYFWRLSWVMVGVATAAFLLIGGSWAVLLLVVFWVAGLLIGLIRTERHLQWRFDEQGQPRT